MDTKAEYITLKMECSNDVQIIAEKVTLRELDIISGYEENFLEYLGSFVDQYDQSSRYLLFATKRHKLYCMAVG